jgi:hypothetical protein
MGAQSKHTNFNNLLLHIIRLVVGSSAGRPNRFLQMVEAHHIGGLDLS